MMGYASAQAALVVSHCAPLEGLGTLDFPDFRCTWLNRGAL